MLRGWATASERTILRVDVSTGGGRSWSQAELQQDLAQAYGWPLWKFDRELGKGDHEMVVRAVDDAMQAQPPKPDDCWRALFQGANCFSRGDLGGRAALTDATRARGEASWRQERPLAFLRLQDLRLHSHADSGVSLRYT